MHRLVGLALVLSASSLAAAPCAIVENDPTVLTRADTAVADGGGVIVATLPNYNRTPKHGALDKWRFADKSTPAIKHVAPGLDVLATPGPAVLKDADRKVLVSVKHAAAKVAELDAPKLAGVSRNSPRNARHAWTATTATLTDSPPADAIALIVFDKAGTTARSWGQVTAATKTVVVFQSGGCGFLPEGTADSAVGESVRFAWLDASGRVSKLSSAVEVMPDPSATF